MSGPQWYPRVVRPCETCEGENQVAKNFGIDSWPAAPEIVACPDCSGGYVDVDATEECGECWAHRYAWPPVDCTHCKGSGRVPSLAALALRLDSVMIEGDDRVWQVIRCDWVADTVDLFHEMAMDETGPVGHHRTVAWSAVTARVVTVDEVERRKQFAYQPKEK